MVELTLIQGDCLKVISKIPDGSIDIIVTDPPYMISREAKIARSRNPLKRGKFKGKDISFMFGEWDIFESEEQYWDFIYSTLNHFKRLLRKGGHLLMFFDKFKITPLVEWCRKNDFVPRQPLYWLKANPVPMARKVSFMNAHEFIFWATKETTSRKFAIFHYELGQHPDYITCPIVPTNSHIKRHPTQKPVEVIKWLLKYLSNENDKVLDPFLGSGTTMQACLELNRNCIGIEISEDYCRNMVIPRLKPLITQSTLTNTRHIFTYYRYFENEDKLEKVLEYSNQKFKQ